MLGKTLNEMLRISGCNFMNGRLGRERSGGGESSRFNDREHPRPRSPPLTLALSLSYILPSLSLSLNSSPRHPLLYYDLILLLPRRLCAHVSA